MITRARVRGCENCRKPAFVDPQLGFGYATGEIRLRLEDTNPIQGMGERGVSSLPEQRALPLNEY